MKKFNISIVLLISFYGVAAFGADKIERLKYGFPKRIATLENKQINESSGICVGKENPKLFWTHNDSGDSARIFGFDSKGHDFARISLSNVKAIDNEDITSFTVDGKNYIMLADVGDNFKKRKYLTLYIIREPKVPEDVTRFIKRADCDYIINFKYSDGPRNCESVAFDSVGRKIIILEKNTKRTCKIYSIDWDNAIKSSKIVTGVGVLVEAKPQTELNLSTTTAMDISPDSKRMIILTYLNAYEYIRKENQTWPEALKGQTPNLVRMPPRRQGESICYGPDGKTLYLTSEHVPTPLWMVPLQKTN